MSLVKNTLSQNGFWMVNKSLVKIVGLDAALLLSDLASRQDYFEGKEFFCSSKIIEEELFFSKRRRQIATEKLRKAGFLSVIKRGMPARYFYKIREKNIIAALSVGAKTLPQEGVKSCPQEGVKTLPHNNNKQIKLKNNTAADFQPLVDQWNQNTGQSIIMDKKVIGYFYNRLRHNELPEIQTAMKNYSQSEYNRKFKKWSLIKLLTDSAFFSQWLTTGKQINILQIEEYKG